MKKFYALLLALDLLAIGTSATAFAHGTDKYEDEVSNDQLVVLPVPTSIEEQQLVHVFNVALKNPKILKQLNDQLALVQRTVSTDREVYDKMMMTANIELIDAMNKKLNPEKKEKKEASYLKSVLDFTKDTVVDTAKMTAPCVLTLFVLSKMPVFRHLFGIADSGLGFFSWLFQAMVG